jgi:LmbE family N-acetylglucosaminyl deacetylase
MNRKIIQTVLAALVASLLLTAPRAQQPTAPPAPEARIALYQALLDLTNPWTVMCIAAHPDDEDGTSLIVMRRKYGAHTVSLFSTFGEGGQNAIGPELYEELGAIRARETMAAAEVQGSEPHFLGLKDFGYSKSADEAFKFWGHDEALRRMVLEIRKLRPDVIITNHSVTNNDHGHHQATARLELEAFDAAADPTRFPDQLSGSVTPWQAQRLFVRARGNQNQTDNSPIVTIDPNGRDQIRGTTFAEEALSGLQKHATQGPWPKSVAQMAARFTNSSDGRLPLIRYRLVREAKGAQPLTKDADSFLAGLVVPPELVPRLSPLWSDQSMIPINERELVFPRLLALAKGFHQANSPQIIMTQPRVATMAKRLDAALAAAAGINVDLAPESKALVPGVPANFKITVANHGSVEAALGMVHLDGMGRGAGGPASGAGRPASTSPVAPGQSVTIEREYQTSRDAAVTVPHQEHLYDGREFGEQFTAIVSVSLKGGGSFMVPATVSVDVAPSIEIAEFGPQSLVITPQTLNVSRTLTLQVINHEKVTRKISIETIAAANNPERRKKIAEEPMTIGPAEKRELSITLPMESGTETQMVTAQRRLVLTPGQTTATVEEPPPFAPNLRLLLRATKSTSNEIVIPMVYAAARVAPNLRVGYVRGFDYSLPNALNALGVESKELSVDEVKAADLQKYTTIIVDNRVYESTPGLIAANQKLLDYANGGGTLIVFYHKSFEWNPDERRQRPQLAPYKLILGDERIVDENAPITFLEPQHPLLNFPNKLGQADFADWIQERGLYYPKDWDPQFQALLQSNDPGEAPLKGGLLVADYGRGRYIYTSMVWYRELRAGVPGAYRMLANMISYGRAK